MIVLADQICAAATKDDIVFLPLSDHPRIRTVINALISQPGDPRSLAEWAVENHMSTRTLTRLFATETGMSFSRWRQCLRVIEAMARLSTGESVLGVALDMGYSSQSAFTTMFRRIAGRLPSEFVRHATGGPGDVLRAAAEEDVRPSD